MVYAFQQWMQGVVDQDGQHIREEGYSQPRVLIIGATQDARRLDPSIQSIFDESIELDVPTPEERLTILRTCTRNHQMHVVSHVDKDGSIPQPSRSSTERDPLERISAKCHGYLAADMDALCTQAGIVACQQGGRGLDKVDVLDFEEAMKSIRVSALRQNTSVQKVAPVYWTDIGGLEGVKVRTLCYWFICLVINKMGSISGSNVVALVGSCGTNLENPGRIGHLAIQTCRRIRTTRH